MKTSLRTLFILVIALISISVTKAQDVNSSKANDSLFITKKIADNLREIQLFELGKSRSDDQQVKNAASQMIVDHTEIINDLKKAAQEKNIVVEKTGGEAENTAGLKELMALQGKEFEKKWIANMLSIHNTKINELEAASSRLLDAELKAINNKALDATRTHRDVLARLQYKYKD